MPLQPETAEFYFDRANALSDSKRFDEALADHWRALALRPDYAAARYRLGLAWQHRYADAAASYRRALDGRVVVLSKA